MLRSFTLHRVSREARPFFVIVISTSLEVTKGELEVTPFSRRFSILMFKNANFLAQWGLAPLRPLSFLIKPRRKISVYLIKPRGKYIHLDNIYRNSHRFTANGRCHTPRSWSTKKMPKTGIIGYVSRKDFGIFGGFCQKHLRKSNKMTIFAE